jgi:hypothetical protein
MHYVLSDKKYLRNAVLCNVRINVNWIVGDCGVELFYLYQIQPSQMVQVILTDIIVTALVEIRLSMTDEYNVEIFLFIYLFGLLWLHCSIQLIVCNIKQVFLSKTKTVNMQFA